MLEKVDNLSDSNRRRFDEIIDVRSPSEFAEDHIPGAVNLPVLSDEQRHEVGTIYCQQSRHEARRIGAAYVTANISEFLHGHFAQKSADYCPLIYCWRGGMRSRSLATILNNVGWYTKVVDGGYRRWRQTVVNTLRESELQHRLILIDGQTGANKTKILSKLATQGHQTLDLEKLAKHRGSVFGSYPDVKQPSQKYFESLIHSELERFDTRQAVFVEAESPKIGRRAIPTALVNKMRCSPRIEIRADAKVRASNLIDCYADLIAEPEKIRDALDYLRPYHASKLIQRWLEFVAQQRFETLALELIEAHYDPCYERQRRKHQEQTTDIIELSSLEDPALDNAAQQIADISAAFAAQEHSGASTSAQKVYA